MPTPPPDDHAARLAQHVATVQAEAAAPVVFPTIHPNGSGAKELALNSAAVADAIDAAIHAERQNYPNARDYPDAADFAAAKAQAQGRIDALRKARDDRWAIFDHCCKAARERAG